MPHQQNHRWHVHARHILPKSACVFWFSMGRRERERERERKGRRRGNGERQEVRISCLYSWAMFCAHLVRYRGTSVLFLASLAIRGDWPKPQILRGIGPSPKSYTLDPRTQHDPKSAQCTLHTAQCIEESHDQFGIQGCWSRVCCGQTLKSCIVFCHPCFPNLWLPYSPSFPPSFPP